MAKVTSKGQITIPVSIRRKLCINEGDKLLFIDSPDGVLMVNPDVPYSRQGTSASGFNIRNSELRGSSLPDALSKDNSAAASAPTINKTTKSKKPKQEVQAATVTPTPPVEAVPPVEAARPVVPAPTVIPAPPATQPPTEEPATELKKPASTVRGFDVSSLLDEIRIIGSKI